MSQREKPASCQGCPCLPHGTDYSIVEGTGSLGTMLVGEASGEFEARTQTPFVSYAPAGSILERVLRRMSISREQVSITNVLRCRPRNNYLDGAKYEHEALAHCRPNLDAAIASRRPRSIVALGSIATRELTGMVGDKRGVSHLAGYCLPGPDNIPTVPTWHPAFIRRGKASYQGAFARNMQRALNVAKGTDRSWLWNVDPGDSTTWGHKKYQIHPSLDVATLFRNWVRDNPAAVIAKDIETPESIDMDEDAREGFVDTEVRQIQFSVARDTAIVFPWTDPYREIAIELLHAPNPAYGHNWNIYDHRVLRACAAREGWRYSPTVNVLDTLDMFHHWQPDLPAHLQFACSFIQFEFPWKHFHTIEHEPFYGACDVDSDWQLGEMLVKTLQRDGIYEGYRSQVYHVRPILDAMADRGLPVDDAARVALDAEFETVQRDLTAELDKEYPDAVRSVSPKQGYVRTPKDLTGLVTRSFQIAALDAASNPVVVSVDRYCRTEAFSPNSGPQLIRYMKHHGHPVPKSRAEDDDGQRKDTTNKVELLRLANKVGDPFYKKVIECRELGKARGTYVEGFRPGPDGRVHTTFTFDTGTGQLSSRSPNVQNFSKHGRLSKALRQMIAAPPGHLLVEADYRSYHALTTGFCAECPDWMRMARLDIHSYVAGHFLKCWDAERIREESDAELLDRFRWFKSDSERKRVRDRQAKVAALGVGFGMGARRLYQENLEHFPDERTAKRFITLLQSLFPRVFAWQDRVRKQAHEQQCLRSPFGHIRRFYEVFRWDSRKGGYANGDQAEEAVAFLPANLAFGNIRECMKEQARLGLDERYGLCNSVHDSFVYCFPEDRLDAFLQEAIPVLIAPSKVLRHPVLAPEGLRVDVEVAAGPDWAHMSEISLKREATV